jgi:hypothetical protein
VDSFDGANLCILGGFDLSYYHDIAIIFHEVSRISAIIDFAFNGKAQAFSVRETSEQGEACFLVVWQGDEGELCEVVCENITVRIKKTLHYDKNGVPIDWKKIEEDFFDNTQP